MTTAKDVWQTTVGYFGSLEALKRDDRLKHHCLREVLELFSILELNSYNPGTIV